MADGNPKDMFESMLQFCVNDKIQEVLNPIRCFSEAAQIRIQAERISVTAKALTECEVRSVLSVVSSVKERFEPMDHIYKGIYRMLVTLTNEELAATQKLTMPADGLYASAYFWRSRVLADMLIVSSYYKVASELISLAMKTLDKCSPLMKAREIVLLF